MQELWKLVSSPRHLLVFEAAIAGEGFAFGWHHVTDHLIAQGPNRPATG